MSRKRQLRPVLVVGARNSGKTAYVRAVAARARRIGLTVAGFFSEAEWRDGVKARYFLCDIADPSSRALLASRDGGPGLDLQVGAYQFSSGAFRAANRSLRRALAADLICIDEFGPLELRGEGFYPAVKFLLRRYRGILLLTARPSVAAALRQIIAAREVPPREKRSGCGTCA